MKLFGPLYCLLWILYRFCLVSILDCILYRLFMQCFFIFVWILLEFCVGFLLELNVKTNWFIITNQTWIFISCNLQVLISQKLHIKALDLLIKNWDIFDFFEHIWTILQTTKGNLWSEKTWNDNLIQIMVLETPLTTTNRQPQPAKN